MVTAGPVDVIFVLFNDLRLFSGPAGLRVSEGAISASSS